ncbi:hypothetical protein BS78_K038200 [Paspalum vaginatum]|uniref:Leucine-rich repeat-containing N-terminal plant-type domain-containing protein n=1 Tax=Paspalum vaginatum TaxID=158149 RepID=A0A9W7X8X8_9POAL|nr:hypothetical protein BS78_K038200 [Paspalum vaginatum]
MFCSHPLRRHCLLIITVIVATSSRGSCLCHKEQSNALLRLKASFNFDYSFSLSSWNVDTNCCTWEGVTCDGTSGYVTALDLSGLYISGNLSSSSDIFKLTSLRFLSLADNYFDASPWPSPGLEQLTDLEYLDLSYSGLSGDLHIENGQLSKLATLNLSGLHLRYLSLEALIDNLGSLQELQLDEANISVTPADLAHASSTNTPSGLKELSMRSRITNNSTLDTVFTNLLFRSKLANLVSLDLYNLDLRNMSLHTLIDSLENLQELYLGNVNISVNPTDKPHASSTNTASGLKVLFIRNCDQFGTALTNIQFRSMLANLVTLGLSDFDLRNLSLHALIGSFGNLENLYLEDVVISASPTHISHASSTNTTSGLKVLSMVFCIITGGHFDTALVTDIRFRSMLANLVTLGLSYFDLRNLSLHALIGSFGNLENLYLEEVAISASPTHISHASSTNTASGLKELRMQWCTITTGHFDAVLSKLPFLSKLILDGTTFSGHVPVPERFAELSSLAVLSLQRCGLKGTFPSRIFHLKNLMYLDVSGNDNLRGVLPEFILASALQVLILSGTKFSGKIPESIGNLRNLTELDLSNCQFHGSIPPFTQWPMISSIDLSGNNLTGSLPSDGYLALHNLTTVHLSNNSMSGVIPASLFSLPSLESLDLSRNNFTGNFLLHLNISSNLGKIDLSNNKLQGPIPKLLSDLVGIYWLDLSFNNFTGIVDLSFIKNYMELDYLSLSYNKLSVILEDGNHSYAGYPTIGELSLASCNLSYVPKLLMHQVEMGGLDLSNNNITGHIPDWIWRTASGLNLSHNLFTSIATNLSNSSLLYLDIHSNKIDGALPLPPLGTSQLDYSDNHFNSSVTLEFWSHISSVISLSLANNSINGEVSHSICNATKIEILDLSFNNFSGLIPACLLIRNKHLEILNLKDNNFHGSLPQDIHVECALQVIDLNSNRLEGKLPTSIINCHRLQVLDVGNNLIVGTFPEWLGFLRFLKVLILHSNRFHGPIDDSYGMKKLQVLDLSSNSFNGSIPTRFLTQFKAMKVVSSGSVATYVEIIAPASASSSASASSPYYRPYFKESVTLTLKGKETTLVQILSVFMNLDLSNNKFEGIIPNEIGDLKFLKGLNLSKNSFTGGIPPRIANMRQLESLDLSCNKLSGEIPPAMAQMSFLEVLNLSYNNLSGMIPQSSQFLTFPDTSFVGNNGLCGKPLPRMCDANHAPSAAGTPGSSKGLNWEILSVEAGVISGLVMVFATTLLWDNGRRWVYWQVDKFLLYTMEPWLHGRRN